MNKTNDFFNKSILVLLTGVLICLIVIAFKISTKEFIQVQPPNVNVSNKGEEIVHIAPNRIGVIDPGNVTGLEQLVIFEYNEETKKFIYVSSLNYNYYLKNADSYGIPVKK